MLSCITCAKQTDERGDGGGGGGGRVSSPSTDESVKSLTTQIKGMALKFSGACKPSSSVGFKKGDRSYHDFDTASEGTPYPSYMHAGNSISTSTSAWDFPNRGVGGGRSLSRLASGYGMGRERIQAGRESVCTESDVFLEDEEEPKEWMAQVEPGVHITFVSLPNGGNDLKRIRFSREMFNKWQAQRWWGENYDRIMELYNVQRFNRQALNTPARSEDEPRDSSYTRLGSPRMTPSLHKDWIPQHSYNYKPPSDYGGGGGSSSAYYGPPGGGGGTRCETSSVDASRTTTSSRDEAASVSISNASELETEWVEQDDPGVYITIRQLADGSRELRRVRFSRERFGEVHAKLWWEQNRERIQAQYL